MHRQPVTSSNLASVGYDRDRHALEVEFTTGSVYEYLLVPESVYQQLLAAPSHGRFFNTRVRDRYPCRAVE